MKRVSIILLTAVVVLAGAGAAWSAFNPLASSDLVEALVGGGHLDVGACFTQNGAVLFCSAIARDFSYDVHGLTPTGAATGTAVNGTIGDGNYFKTRITCMTVVGNAAVIGGYVTADPTAPDRVGWAVWRAVIDNGDPGNGSPPDQASYNLFSPPDDPTIPRGFPNTCGFVPADFGFADLLAGDFSIHSGL